MNKQAFRRGFLKAAVEAKVVPSPAVDQLQQSLNSGVGHVGSLAGQGAQGVEQLKALAASSPELLAQLKQLNSNVSNLGPSVGGAIGGTLLDRMNTAVSAGSGGLMGAGAGGALGYWLGKDENEKKDNRGLTSLLGALAGGGVGMAGGALMAPKIG